MERVRLLQGLDYSGVDHEHLTANPDGSTAGPMPADRAPRLSPRPTGWPAEMPLPDDDPGWAGQATAWLLECIPPDFRAHAVVHDPSVLTWMAAGHVQHALVALRAGYRTAAVDLKPHLPPHAIADALEAYRVEGRRLTEAAAAIKVVGAALRAHGRS
ncbi:hypothetical protein HD597_012872 [Nonomuraea thailandensis]|uniref:Uncharacterized protein n=1 Tax=Nonomuraea thailandensis TaxID=1188745 RepID=A0A9X2KA48_9ACTN|nr:hypothetical protein [Nonomuraea thailandensis]MCP2365768.1 hypothetical protein [Nonomuraea thailandensis]